MYVYSEYILAELSKGQCSHRYLVSQNYDEMPSGRIYSRGIRRSEEMFRTWYRRMYTREAVVRKQTTTGLYRINLVSSHKHAFALPRSCGFTRLPISLIDNYRDC